MRKLTNRQVTQIIDEDGFSSKQLLDTYQKGNTRLEAEIEYAKSYDIEDRLLWSDENKETNYIMAKQSKQIRDAWYIRLLGEQGTYIVRGGRGLKPTKDNIKHTKVSGENGKHYNATDYARRDVVASLRRHCRNPINPQLTTPPPNIGQRYMELHKGELVSVELECVFRDHRDIPKRSALGKHLISLDGDGSVHYIRSRDDEEGDGIDSGSAECKVTFRQKKPQRLMGVLRKLLASNAEVNSTCGTHIHLDQRGLSKAMVQKKAKRLIKCLPALTMLVAPSRQGNSYARINRPVYAGRTYYHERNRYRAINYFDAYRKHGTIEVRLHGGTLDFWKIIGWIDLCLFISNSAEVDQIANRVRDPLPSSIPHPPIRELFVTIEELIRMESLPSHVRVYVWRRLRQFHPTLASDLREKLIADDRYDLTDGMMINP